MADEELRFKISKGSGMSSVPRLKSAHASEPEPEPEMPYEQQEEMEEQIPTERGIKASNAPSNNEEIEYFDFTTSMSATIEEYIKGVSIPLGEFHQGMGISKMPKVAKLIHCAVTFSNVPFPVAVSLDQIKPGREWITRKGADTSVKDFLIVGNPTETPPPLENVFKPQFRRGQSVRAIEYLAKVDASKWGKSTDGQFYTVDKDDYFMKYLSVMAKEKYDTYLKSVHDQTGYVAIPINQVQEKLVEMEQKRPTLPILHKGTKIWFKATSDAPKIVENLIRSSEISASELREEEMHMQVRFYVTTVKHRGN